jgi:hypothetical protein
MERKMFAEAVEVSAQKEHTVGLKAGFEPESERAQSPSWE